MDGIMWTFPYTGAGEWQLVTHGGDDDGQNVHRLHRKMYGPGCFFAIDGDLPIDSGFPLPDSIGGQEAQGPLYVRAPSPCTVSLIDTIANSTVHCCPE